MRGVKSPVVSLVPLLGKDLTPSYGGANGTARLETRTSQVRQKIFLYTSSGKLMTPTALGQGHCPPSRTCPCEQVAPCCPHSSSPLIGKGCLHIMCCVHYWGLSAVPKAFTHQASSPMSLPVICGVPVQSLEPPENSGYPAHQGQCTFSSVQDIQATRAIIIH